jgi:LysR family transcriptional regulator, regulator of abg operon
MKLNQLRDVTAIAEHGSLRAAARGLRLAQPALTRSVRELEHELGAPLFERRTRGMVLTLAGEAFVRRAKAILSDVERARVEVDQIIGGVGGSLVAGLSIAAHILLLPRSLKRFNKRYPDVHLKIIEGFFPTLIGGLRDGSVDFYIGPRPSGHIPEGLLVEKLFDNTRQIVCRVGHPLAQTRGKPVSLRDLSSADWLTTSITQEANDELGAIFRRHELPPPRLVAQTQSALSVMLMLLHSDVLAMMPVQFSQFALVQKAITSIPVMEALPALPIVLVRRAGFSLTPAAEYFVELLRNRPQSPA